MQEIKWQIKQPQYVTFSLLKEETKLKMNFQKFLEENMYKQQIINICNYQTVLIKLNMTF